jgi:hypothetical protein
MKQIVTAVFAAVLVALVACQSIRTIIADFAIDGRVRMIDRHGAEVAGESTSLDTLARDPRRLSLFGDLHYAGNTLRATLIVNSDTIRGSIENKSASSVNIRFDEAVMSSNMHEGEVPMQVASAGQLASMPAMRLAPGQQGHLYIAPSYAAIFPTKRLFNVQFDGKQPVMLKDGIGNAVRLRVPVEVDGKRLFAVIDMKVNQSSVRSSYR